MNLYATGFNAWHQLDFGDSGDSNEPDDISTFQPVLQDHTIKRPHAALSYTLVETSSGWREAGTSMEPDRLKSKLLSSTAAVAGNGKLIEYDGNGTIHEYASMPHHLASGDPRKFSGIGPIVQLAAYETGFVALSEDGHVWTWGDERYGACLGREISEANPAEKPGLVEELEDLPTGKITRIAAAGYIVLALTEGRDLYAWGGHPGRRAILEELSSQPTPILVEDHDIVDCGIGDAHIIVLTSNGEVFVIGDNTNGQLGLRTPSGSIWNRLPSGMWKGQSVVGVEAGPRNSFVLTQYTGP
ncbi:RCC1/BLIP-II [Xylariomycetidae sp. FL2044]|nr:RCC1/BLIP-II [Xylariomycetidae sp. FL2044]